MVATRRICDTRAMQRPAVEFASNGDVTLAYQLVGDGPSDLLYLPGYFSNLDVQWESPHMAAFLNGLAEHARLIITDRRGWGCSERFAPDKVPPLEELGDDVGAVLDAAGSQRAVVMASWESGMVAQIFAAAHPERVRGLILVDSLVSAAESHQTPWMPDRTWWDSMFESYERDWGRRWNPSGYTARLGPDEGAWFMRIQRACCTPKMIAAEGRRFISSSTAEVLPAIRVPTLVMSNAAERPGWPQNGPFIAQRTQGARLVPYDGRGDHMWYHPAAEIVREAGDFVASLHEEFQAVFDRVLATVLFTDIVDSTAQAAAMGDRAWRATRERHDAVVRAQLARYRGREVKTMGDGFLITFDGPARAVRCAQAIVAGVDELGIEVRAGLHIGEIELDGDDVTGIAVAIGARVGAIAHPSEVLVSKTIKDLTAGSGIVYADNGEHELKGVPDSWRLYQAVG